MYQIKGGRWVATWPIPGRKYPGKATGKTREEAIRRRAEKKLQTNPSSEDLVTVGALADWWLENVQKAAVRPQSWRANRNHVVRIKETLGNVAVTALDYPTVATWQTDLLNSGELAAKTVREHRQTLAQVMEEAVKMGTIPANPVRSLKPPPNVIPDKDALTSEQIQALVKAVQAHRLAAAVALLFMQGWRISEVMGLATDDVDLEDGRAYIRRASVYVTGVGQVLQPYPKEDDSMGEYWLQPPVVELVKTRLDLLEKEKADAADWHQQHCDGRPVELIFTKLDGRLLRIHDVAAVIAKAVDKLGLKVSLGTHGGRRSVVTTMFSEGNESLDDIAKYVGHGATQSTARYVKRLGKRPKAVAERASKLFVPKEV